MNAGRLEALAICSFDHIRFGPSRTTTSLGRLRGAYLGHYTFDVSINLLLTLLLHSWVEKTKNVSNIYRFLFCGIFFFS